MVARVLHDEARAFGVRVQLLIVDTPANGEGEDVHLCARWPSALEIGARAIGLIRRNEGKSITRPVVPFRTLLPARQEPPFGVKASTDPSPPPDPDTAQDSSIVDARRLLLSLTFPNRNEVSP